MIWCLNCYITYITDLPHVLGRSQHRRSAKPLLNKKFYLDIKNHHTSSNLEQKLKSLGAVRITLFYTGFWCFLLRNVLL